MGGGRLVGRVLRRGEEDAIGQLHALIVAPSSITVAERTADRWARVLTAVALVLAVVALWAHSVRAGFAVGLEVALSVLVVRLLTFWWAVLLGFGALGLWKLRHHRSES